MGESMLSKTERKYLLSLARSSIEHYLIKRNILKLEISELTELKKLNSSYFEKLGCFVTIKNLDGELRGCIGLIESDRALIDNVIEYAVVASQEDPRFPPVEKEELSDLTLEISVMGKVEKLPNLESIIIGKHGLIVKQGRCKGLLLPQVPVEWGWSLTQFLEHTCMKAGLHREAYKDPTTEIFYFSAEVFSEKEQC